MSNMQHSVEGSTLTLTRTIDAPRQKVWDAFAKPDLFVIWWGPQGWRTEVKEFNFSEGGVIHYGMKCEDEAQGEWYGKYSWGKMIFSDIRPLEQIAYVDYFADEQAVVQDGMPQSTTILEFKDNGDTTTLVSTSVFESEAALKQVMDMGMLEGITQTWDRLDALVTGK